MALSFNADFHRQTRAMEYARVARGVAFDAAQPRQQRDPSYKGVAPNSTGSWATPFTINHDESWKPLVPLRQQNMDIWGQENTYRYMMSRNMISGGYSRSPEAQKYFNERMKQKGAQATKLHNPLALGKRIRKALAPPDFGKFDLAQKLERLDNQLDTIDKMTVVFDTKGTLDLLDSIRASLFALAPTFTVSEAQDTFEVLGKILQKAEALLTTAFGKDIQHIQEADNPYFDPERLKQNTRRLASFVSNLRKLYQFVEQIYANASNMNERVRSANAVAAATALFSRTELNSSVREAEEQLKRWTESATKDESRMLEDQSAAEQYEAELEQQIAAQEGETVVPAFEARETAAAAASAAAASAAVGFGEEEEAAPAAAPAALSGSEKEQLFDILSQAVINPFEEYWASRNWAVPQYSGDFLVNAIRDEEAGTDVSPIVKSILDEIYSASVYPVKEDDEIELIYRDDVIRILKYYDIDYTKYPFTQEPPRGLLFNVVFTKEPIKIKRKKERVVAEPASVAAPASAAAPRPRPVLGPGSSAQDRNDYIKYRYYIDGLTQKAILQEVNALRFPVKTQGAISKIIRTETKQEFRDRTGY